MRVLNSTVFIAFLLLGAIFVFSWAIGAGSVLAATLFLGWFPTMFSFCSFIVAVVQILRGEKIDLYRELYFCNFALALLAIAAIGVTRDDLKIYILLSTIGAVIGLLLSRIEIIRHRLAPAVSLLPIVLMFPWAPTQWGFWTCQFMGVLCVVLALVVSITKGGVIDTENNRIRAA